MNLFSCSVCGNQLYYESYQCTVCGASLGYSFGYQRLFALREEGNGQWVPTGPSAPLATFRRCQNQELAACNWVIPVLDEQLSCESCRLTLEVSDLSLSENQAAWALLERAKRRLLYTLKNLGLPIESQAQRAGGMGFRFLRGTKENPVLIGHDCGTITVNLEEASVVYREEQRERLGEAYRTPLGHFRHEMGHYYFDRLLTESHQIEDFRSLFGDERASYQEALKRHYEQGAPTVYEDQYISAYATMHPWEDWAETWSHYLHMVDTLETAQSYGVLVDHTTPFKEKQVANVTPADFDALMSAWVPVTLAINGLNRSMGLPDAYPFAISPRVQEKLRFIHQVICEARSGGTEDPIWQAAAAHQTATQGTGPGAPLGAAQTAS